MTHHHQSADRSVPDEAESERAVDEEHHRSCDGWKKNSSDEMTPTVLVPDNSRKTRLTGEEEVDAVPKVVKVRLVQPLLEPPVDPQPQQDPEGAHAEDLKRGNSRF